MHSAAGIFSDYFNPRSDERSDLFAIPIAGVSYIFQSTLRRTERQCVYRIYTHSDRFQSTLRRTERPYKLPDVGRDIDISIHAPTNGATYHKQFLVCRLRISIHAPTNGATSFADGISIAWEFQSTLRRTERPLSLVCTTLSDDFNPRSDERSDSQNLTQKL